MAEIRVLDKHTAELIAAGEVVERPASVAKELLENAIDAGATQITLSAVRGGIQQLQIVDNGSGIEAEYIDKAFIRHATSKIATAEDLGHIHTLGFRGEALASIASVARVEVLTRTEADEYACCYRIEGGEERGMEPGARPVGTTITVSDLFYNTPARMKFLKKDASEGTFVAETVLHAALSHPEISFRYLRDGKQQYVTPGDGDLRSAVYAVLGREFARDLLPVDGGSELYHVTGLVTPPRACRASRGAQHFFVNGRYVKNRTMMAALENAYKGTMMQGKFPGAVLMLELPPDMVDVNVHPAKTEIRFAKESDVFDAVYRAVRAALATPGSGECRFEMGHTAPEEKPGQTDDAGNIQIGTQRGLLLADQIGLVGSGAEEGVGVLVGVDGNRVQAQIVAGAENTHCDLAAVGHQNFFDLGGVHEDGSLLSFTQKWVGIPEFHNIYYTCSGGVPSGGKTTKMRFWQI